MNIKNHGTWRIYTPAKLPEGAPQGALFTRRVGDGVDWYGYSKSNAFAKTSVKMTMIDGIVKAAVTDPTMLFPGNSTVLEVSEGPAGNPQDVFGDKIYDADAQSFRDPPPPPEDPLIALRRRIEALEKP